MAPIPIMSTETLASCAETSRPERQRLTPQVKLGASVSPADRRAARDRSPTLRAHRGRVRAPVRPESTTGTRCATCGEQRDYAEPACPRVWTLNDVSLAPTRKVYRFIRAISPAGVLASTFSRVSLRCRLAWKSESVVMLRAVASCSESKPKHQSSLLSFSEAVKRGAFDAVNRGWSGT